MKTRYILIPILIYFFYLPLQAATYNIDQTQTISLTTGYINSMNETWNIVSTVTDKPLRITYNTSTETNYDFVSIYSVDNAGVATKLITLSGQQSGNISTGITNGKAKIVFTSDGSNCYSASYTGLNISFAVDNSLSLSDNLYVSGSVGIGTSTPKEKLEVNGNIRGNQTAGAVNFKTDFGSIWIGAMNALWAHIQTDMPKFIFNKPIYATTGEMSSYQGINLSLQTYGTTRMTILNSNGNVGIGTATPTQALNVVGRIGVSPSGTGSDEGYNGGLMITKPQASGQYINLIRSGIVPWSIGTVYNSSTFAIGIGKSPDAGFTAPFFNIDTNGNVGIGTTIPDSKLTVNGKIHATEVVVDVNIPADYVFNSNYKLMPLHEVEKYVNTNNHLPEIPSASEIKKNGMSMGEMQNKLLQKIEELTLYIIDQQKKIEVLEQKVK